MKTIDIKTARSALADVSPHAGMLRYPDVSKTQIVFSYANDLWVVPREAIREVHDFPDELHRTYHRVDGYSLKEKLRLARERAGTAADR